MRKPRTSENLSQRFEKYPVEISIKFLVESLWEYYFFMYKAQHMFSQFQIIIKRYNLYQTVHDLNCKIKLVKLCGPKQYIYIKCKNKEMYNIYMLYKQMKTQLFKTHFWKIVISVRVFFFSKT